MIGVATSLAAALAAVVAADLDVADTLARLVADCATDTGADAAALLVRDERGELSLLGTTSHRPAELELLGLQRTTGPCADAMAARAPVRSGGVDLLTRWPDLGVAIMAAGYTGVEAFPMTWRGAALGGLTLYRRDGVPPAATSVGQAFADVATLVVVQSAALSHSDVRAGLDDALVARAVVEQAKGVIAYREHLDMQAAYDHLLTLAARSRSTLTDVALVVIREGGAR